MIRIYILSLMKKKKMSRRQLSALTGIRPDTIIKYCERKVKRFNAKDLIKICDVLDCKLSDLIEYIPNKNDIE